MTNDRIVFHSPEILEHIMKALNSVAMPEFQFELSPSGILHSKLDSSRAAHIRINIPESYFKEFSVSQTRQICVNMERLTTVVKRLIKYKDQAIEMLFVDNEMFLTNLGSPKREFSLNFLDPREVGKDLNIESTTIIDIDTKELEEQIKDMKGTAVHAIFEVLGGNLSITCKSDDGKAMVITPSDSEFITVHNATDAKAMYALSYMTEIVKFLKGFETVKMELSTNLPLTFVVNEGQVEFRILLAPRVERR